MRRGVGAADYGYRLARDNNLFVGRNHQNLDRGAIG